MELRLAQGHENARWQRTKAWLVSAFAARANRYCLPLPRARTNGALRTLSD
ncbi:hypothetical protein OI450_08500 [Pectobacterium cacticida]|uniref:Uncharacterized protein n=1 Tax=Pectobacterium cacticida TaxID=69221 RepID=A0ABZ2G5W7_9GAMM|nr:hypothetical protein [Pectobacterium cacticida]UYX08369.1 hypothetical protein OI450_08500 [Pectobacterium cacticida]